LFSRKHQLWNASQLEMVHKGKMHGFMRYVASWWILVSCLFPFEVSYVAHSHSKLIIHVVMKRRESINFSFQEEPYFVSSIIKSHVQNVLGKEDTWVDTRTWRSPWDISIFKWQGNVHSFGQRMCDFMKWSLLHYFLTDCSMN